MSKKPRIISTQKEITKYLRILSPRWRIRLPIKDKRGPFLYKIKDEIPGHVIRIRESTFYKMRDRGRLQLVKRVDSKKESYLEFRLPSQGEIARRRIQRYRRHK